MDTTSKQPPTLILASGSPYRQALLRSAGVPFTVVVAPIDEAAVTAKTPVALAAARAKAKAEAVAALHPNAWVIGADQVLSHQGVAFDKVSDAASAKARLKLLSGSTHYLHSAVHVTFGEKRAKAFVIDVAMPMRALSKKAIDAYVATGEWQGSVGCYQFEHRGVLLFDDVEADHSAIIGLPLQPLFKRLRAAGFDPLLAGAAAD